MKRKILLFLTAGVIASVSLVATQEGAETRRFWRDRTALQQMTGEDWGKYSRVMNRPRRSRPYYRPTSTTIQQPRSERRIRRSVQPDYSATRTSNGVLKEKQVYSFREMYADGQSRQAMRAALGEPAEHTWNTDRWKIARLGIDGKPTGEYGTFEASYSWGNGGWDGPTTTPPKANW